MHDKITLIQTLGLLLAASFILFFGLDYYPLANGKEALYAEIAREMLSLGDFVKPHFNFAPYMDTPPLYYWLTSLNYTLFGITTFTARAIPAFCCVLLLFMMLRVGQRLRNAQVAWLGAVILLSSAGFVGLSRCALVDVCYAATIAGALFYYYLWQHQQQARDSVVSFIFIALSILFKGMLALVFILPIVVLTWFFSKERKGRLHQYFCPLNIGVCCLLVVPWYVIFFSQDHSLFFHYLSHEPLIRLLGFNPLYGDNLGSWFYYMPGLLLLLFPWGFLLPPCAVYFFRQRHLLSNFSVFLLVWFLFGFIFYSMLPVKSPYYLINFSVPGALLLSQYCASLLNSGKVRLLHNLFYMATFVLLALITSFAVIIYRADGILTQGEHAAIFAAGIMLFFCIAGFVFYYLYRRDQYVAFYLIASLILPVLLASIVAANEVKDLYSEQQLAALIEKEFKNVPLFIYNNLEAFSSLIFYTSNPISLIEDDAVARLGAKGKQLRPASLADNRVNLREFKHSAEKKNVLVIVSNNEKLLGFSQAVSPELFCTLFRDGHALLMTNQLLLCERFRLN